MKEREVEEGGREREWLVKEGGGGKGGGMLVSIIEYLCSGIWKARLMRAEGRRYAVLCTSASSLCLM